MLPSPMQTSPLVPPPPDDPADARGQPLDRREQNPEAGSRGASEREDRTGTMQRMRSLDNPALARPTQGIVQSRGERFSTPQHYQQQGRAPPEPMRAAQVPQMHAQCMPAPPFAQQPTPQFGHAPPPYPQWQQWPHAAPSGERPGVPTYRMHWGDPPSFAGNSIMGRGNEQNKNHERTVRDYAWDVSDWHYLSLSGVTDTHSTSKPIAASIS